MADFLKQLYEERHRLSIMLAAIDAAIPIYQGFSPPKNTESVCQINVKPDVYDMLVRPKYPVAPEARLDQFTRWKEDDIHKLKLACELGYSLEEIAPAFARDPKTIIHKARELRLEMPESWRKYFTKEESVIRQAIGANPPRTLTEYRWKPEEKATLIQMKNDGKNYHEIAAALNRRYSSVSSMWHQLKSKGIATITKFPARPAYGLEKNYTAGKTGRTPRSDLIRNQYENEGYAP